MLLVIKCHPVNSAPPRESPLKGREVSAPPFRQLEVGMGLRETANFLINLGPVGKGDYSTGMLATIDSLPVQHSHIL